MAAGTALGGLLFIAWSQVYSLWTFYLILAGVGVVQAMTLYEPAFAVVARRFRDDPRRAITSLTLWGGFASTVFVPLTQFLIDQSDWRSALVMLGLINLLFCAALYALTINPRKDPPPLAPAGAEAGEVLAGNGAMRWALRQPVFWGLLIAFSLYLGSYSGLIFHLYPLLLERGYDSATTVAALAIIGPAQVAGRIVIWMFAAGASIRHIGMVTVLLFPAGLAVLFADSLGFLAPALFAVLYGAGNGIFTVVRGTCVPEMLTREAYGSINGAISAPAFVLRAAAPLLAALLWSWAGSYTAVLIAAIGTCLLVAAAFWFASLQPKPVRDASPAQRG
ncbi:MAG: MFS transporter [Alphaproteobacteria bacterium]|nr:MAG: MFS transporter [Alphaproteobacteria bacterium]